MASANRTSVPRIEPIWWALFSAGGFVSAFLVPVHLFVNGLAVPLGWLDTDIASYARMSELINQPLVRIYLFVLIALPLYTWAHRFLFTVQDMGLARFRKPLAVLCYGSAVTGSFWAVWILW
ncbi:MAG: fumarate reductase subunit FrdD [Acidobacteriota bacterium]|nr:fumarate reductase subunit D [Acidobacteriota bacterium]